MVILGQTFLGMFVCSFSFITWLLRSYKSTTKRISPLNFRVNELDICLALNAISCIKLLGITSFLVIHIHAIIGPS